MQVWSRRHPLVEGGVFVMSTCKKCICSERQRLEEQQAYISDIRGDLLAHDVFRRTEGLRRLYAEMLESGDLWADRIGHAAQVDSREGFLAGLVELLLCVAFDEWPPDREEDLEDFEVDDPPNLDVPSTPPLKPLPEKARGGGSG